MSSPATPSILRRGLLLNSVMQIEYDWLTCHGILLFFPSSGIPVLTRVCKVCCCLSCLPSYCSPLQTLRVLEEAESYSFFIPRAKNSGQDT